MATFGKYSIRFSLGLLNSVMGKIMENLVNQMLSLCTSTQFDGVH